MKNQNSRFVRRSMNTVMLCLAFAVLGLASACDDPDASGDRNRHQPNPNARICVRPVERFDAAVFLVYDVSGSFEDKTLLDGLAWKYSLATVAKLQTERPRWNVKLIIAQISGSTNPILYTGSLRGLRRKFKDVDQFHAFINSKIDRSGSRVHESIRKIVSHALAIPAIRNRTIPSVLMVMSDMEDTFPSDSKAALLDTLKQFAQTRASVGLYWVDSGLQPLWEEHLEKAGFKDSIVRGEHQDYPPLPKFR